LTIGVGLLGLHFVFQALAAFSSNADSVGTASGDRRDPLDTGANAQTGPVKEARWSSRVFAAIEWRRFEAVVETLFAQEGYETRSQLHGADGGVDIWLHPKNPKDPVSVVQCKHWQGNPISVKELREFLGVMASHGIKRGIFATSSRYTSDAMAFARANGIDAHNGNDLLRLIAQRSPEQQARLLEVAYEGEYWKPTCANCGIKMVQREAKRDGSRFWGCMNYPRCKCTLSMKPAH
jgi:restriction system protein